MAVDYSSSEKDRELIIKRRQRNTARVFEAMRKDIDDRIAEMNMFAVSDRVKRQQLEEIRDELQKSLRAFYSDLEDGLKNDMESIGESVLSDSKAFYKALDMPIQAKITSFPVEIMESVVNGSVYKDKWFLSEAIWGDYKQKLQSINDVVTSGIGLNLSSLEIAKNLEQFVDPKAMKTGSAIVTKCLQDPNTGKLYSMDYVKRHPEKDWTGFAPKTSRFFYGKVDYNAQRLSRTLVSHAYQQNVVKQAQANPFATGVMWLASGGERMCEICEERDGKIFPVDDVPMDHPNGMCTFTVETPSMMEMSDTLADWVNGEFTDWDDQLNAYYEGRPIEHKVKLLKVKKKKEVVKANKQSEEKQNGTLNKTDVRSFRDIKDIKKALEKLCKFNKGKVYIDGMSYDAAKEMYSAYERVFERYPWLVGKLAACSCEKESVVGKNAFADCNMLSGRVSVNESYFSLVRIVRSAYEKTVNNHFHPNGTDWRSVFTHELGHAVSFQYNNAQLSLTERSGYDSTKWVRDRVMGEFGRGRESIVSKYATKDSDEFFAECFAMYIDGDRSAWSKDEKRIMNIFGKALDELDSEYRRKYR